MTVDLTGKVALVTGARQGIGAAAAMALAKAGAVVLAAGRRDGDCKGLVAEIETAGGKAFDLALDVAALDSIAGQMEHAVRQAGRLDIVVNNAGTIEPMSPISRLDPSAFDLAMRTNVSGPAAIVAAAWPHFSNGGRVVNILSGAALNPLVGWAAYCSSKAALLMLSRAIELEGASQNIHGFGLAPGLVDTAMQTSIRAAKINQISDIPREKLSKPDDAAAAIVWLASGRGDAHAGTMVDVRNADFRSEVGL